MHTEQFLVHCIALCTDFRWIRECPIHVAKVYKPPPFQRHVIVMKGNSISGPFQSITLDQYQS